MKSDGKGWEWVEVLLLLSTKWLPCAEVRWAFLEKMSCFNDSNRPRQITHRTHRIINESSFNLNVHNELWGDCGPSLCSGHKIEVVAMCIYYGNSFTSNIATLHTFLQKKPFVKVPYLTTRRFFSIHFHFLLNWTDKLTR